MLDKRTIVNLQDLALKAKKREGIILFVGAGFSSLAGLPSFSELKEKMKGVVIHDALRTYIDEDDLEAFMSAIRTNPKHRIDKNNIQNLIKKELEIKDTHVNAVRHVFDYLMCLPIKCIITTNYDELLETCCKHLEKEYTKGTRLEFRTFADYVATGNSVPIFKIHGDVNNDDVSDLIIGYKDKSISIKDKDRDGFLDVFSFLISQYPILYLGYSLNDEFSKSVVERTASLTSQNNIFSVVKDFKKNINPSIINAVNPLIVPDYEIDHYEDIAKKLFYEYYSRSLEDAVLTYDVFRLKKKLDIDFDEFIHESRHQKKLLQSIGYVLYHSKFKKNIKNYFEKSVAQINANYSPVPQEIQIDLLHLHIFSSLADFHLGNQPAQQIVDGLEHVFETIDKMPYPADEDLLIEFTELRNTAIYNYLVVSILALENGDIRLNTDKIELYFTMFQEPISVIIRMKIFKYKSIYHKVMQDYETSLKDIRISKYHSKHIDYKREVLLIQMNEQAILTKVHVKEGEHHKLRTVIQHLQQITDDFNDLGYDIGMQYANVYLYEAIVNFLKVYSDKQLKTLKRALENMLSISSVDNSVQKLFFQMQADLK